MFTTILIQILSILPIAIVFLLLTLLIILPTKNKSKNDLAENKKKVIVQKNSWVVRYEYDTIDGEMIAFSKSFDTKIEAELELHRIQKLEEVDDDEPRSSFITLEGFQILNVDEFISEDSQGNKSSFFYYENDTFSPGSSYFLGNIEI